MLPYIGAYLFLSLATAISVYQEWTFTDVAASIITGLTWPLYATVRLLRKLRS